MDAARALCTLMVMTGLGMAGQGAAWLARRGPARHGKARRGRAGMAGLLAITAIAAALFSQTAHAQCLQGTVRFVGSRAAADYSIRWASSRATADVVVRFVSAPRRCGELKETTGVADLTLYVVDDDEIADLEVYDD